MTDTVGVQLTRGLLLTGLLLALLGGAIGALQAVEHERPALARAAELSYLPKGDYLKLAVLGYHQLAADILWLQVVQHFGQRNESAEGYLWTYHAVDVITDLDPKFTQAYLATGTILGVWAGRLQESIAILEKGLRHNPDTWELPFFIGYDYFYELCDPAAAAKYFRMASALPGSPPYLPRLAARMTVEVGDHAAALEFLQRLRQQVQDDRLKEALEQRIREVSAEQDLAFLQEAVRRFRSRYGRPPQRIEQLVSGGILTAIPEEPLGGRYEIKADGTVASTGLRERLRVHRKGACQKPASEPERVT